MSFRTFITLHLRFVGSVLKDARTIISLVLFAMVVFFYVHLTQAATPNPGHPWTDIGNGTFQIANTQTVLRTFTFPDASANVLTDAAAVTVAQGGTGVNTLAANGILYGNGTSAVSAVTPAANSVLLTNASNVPILATALPSGVQTNITALGAVTGGSIGPGFGSINIGTSVFTGNGSGLTSLTASNINAGTVGVAYGGTGANTLAANALLVGNGTSAFQTIAPSATAGSRLVSNGTNWTTESPINPSIYQSVDQYAGSATAVTALVTGGTYFQYMGVSQKSYTSCNVLLNLTTAAATVTWAEVALFSGTPVLNGSASLTRLGFTSTATTFTSAGAKATSVTATIPAGTQLWVAFGSSATTPFQVRGMLADTIQSGTFQTATVRPSTATVPQATTIATATAIPAWVTMQCQ